MVLETLISEKFEVPVWRMEIDEVADTLLLEFRDTANKQVSFASVNLNSGKVNFKDLMMPERWLTGLEAAAGGVALLHGFQSEDLPVHKGLTAIDTINREVLWADYNINFEAHHHDGFLVSDNRFEPKKIYLVDARTGIKFNTSLPYETLESRLIFPQITSPEQLPPGRLPVTPHGGTVHYLKHNDYEIISLHALNGVRLTQHLYIFSNEGKLVFDEVITDQIQKLQPEAFICYKNQLIWLKNRSEVKVLNL